MPKGMSARSPSLTSQESTYSAVIIADMVAEVQDHKKEDTITNGTNISKGVILNALQFGQNENKLNKPVVTVTHEKEKHTSSFKDDFNQMSSIRKVAFGFSFLPSVMFVLCFAVIFPCERILPCVDVQWNLNLNDTEVTSNLLAPLNVLFTFSNTNGSGLRSISESTGALLWENNLTSSSKFFECGKFAYADKQSCLILDDNGTIHLFNPSDGSNLMELKLNAASLTVLPDCNKDGLDEIAVALSNSQIRILSMRNILIQDCDSVPSNMMSWKRQRETHLIFTCQKGKNEILMKVSQEEWCRTDTNDEAKISILTSQNAGILSQSKFLPLHEGLILWTQESITMFKNDNHYKWSVPSTNHSSKNRFLMSGKFRKDKKEVFLYSSDISSKLQVTKLNAENGNTIETKSYPTLELTEAVLLNGEDYDFLLGLKKRKQRDESLKNRVVSQINEVTNILTNKEVVSLNTSSRIIQEITLMEMDGNDLKTLSSDSHASSFTVNTEKDLLKLFILRKGAKHSETSIKRISVSNWDTSTDKTSHCVWK